MYAAAVNMQAYRGRCIIYMSAFDIMAKVLAAISSLACLFVNVRSQTYTRYKVDYPAIAPRLQARCLTHNVTHLNCGVYSRILQRYNVNLAQRITMPYIRFSWPPVISSVANSEPPSFHHKFIDKFPAAVYRHIRLSPLFRVCSRALPFGLAIYRLVPLSLSRIHARWIKGRRNDRYEYIWSRARESVLLRRIFKQFLFIYFYGAYGISQSSKLNTILRVQ